MIIIIEGPDGAGKTTLARDIVVRTTARCFHKSAPTKRSIDEYLLPDGSSLVLDRWHLGELVYGPLVRGETDMDDETFLVVEDKLKARGAVLVVLNPPVPLMVARLKERGEVPLESRLVLESEAFAAVFERSRLPKWYMPVPYEPVFVDNVIAWADQHAY
jgi:thymidylate kinase